MKIIFYFFGKLFSKKKINQIIKILRHYSHDIKKANLILLHIPLNSA